MNQGSYYTFAETVAKIIRIILDFESSDASSYAAQMPTIKAAKILKKHAPTEHHKDGFLSKLIMNVFKPLAEKSNHSPVYLKAFNEYENL